MTTIEKNTILKMVTNLSAEKLMAMFNLCTACEIKVMHDEINIINCQMDEMMVNPVSPHYYEPAIRSAFHKYVKMYNSIIKG